MPIYHNGQDVGNVIFNVSGVVRYDTEQSLTEAQKAQARENIDAPRIIYYDVTTNTFPEGFTLYYNGTPVKNKEIYDREMAGIQQILRVTHPDPDSAGRQETSVCRLYDVRYKEEDNTYLFIFQTIRYYLQLVRYTGGGASASNAYFTNTVINLYGG